MKQEKGFFGNPWELDSSGFTEFLLYWKIHVKFGCIFKHYEICFRLRKSRGTTETYCVFQCQVYIKSYKPKAVKFVLKSFLVFFRPSSNNQSYSLKFALCLCFLLLNKPTLINGFKASLLVFHFWCWERNRKKPSRANGAEQWEVTIGAAFTFCSRVHRHLVHTILEHTKILVGRREFKWSKKMIQIFDCFIYYMLIFLSSPNRRMNCDVVATYLSSGHVRETSNTCYCAYRHEIHSSNIQATKLVCETLQLFEDSSPSTSLRPLREDMN